MEEGGPRAEDGFERKKYIKISSVAMEEGTLKDSPLLLQNLGKMIIY